jgi:hypothetical protein
MFKLADAFASELVTQAHEQATIERNSTVSVAHIEKIVARVLLNF